MNGIQIFNNAEFGDIRTVIENEKILFCASDVARALGYSNPRKAISDHCRWVTKRYVPHPQGKSTLEVNFISEGDIYRLIVRSKLPSAEKFESWVFDDVLPSIRQYGSYSMDIPKDLPSALIAYANTLREKEQLKLKVEAQAQQIAEFKPIKDYVDVILKSTETLTITQIAADYGLSAKALNKILHEEKIQYKVSGQWILYNKEMNKGYTKSETRDYPKSDGTIGTKIYTKWTQKGRLRIHDILTNLGYIANYDKERLF